MKVKLLTLAAGPTGVIQPGQVVSLPDEMAQALIDGGYAVAARRPVAVEPETTTLPPAENTSRPPARQKKR